MVVGLATSLYGNIYILRVFPSVYGGVRDNWFEPNRVLEYGNILTDIVDPCMLFSTHRVAANLGALVQAGTAQGVALTQPNYVPPVPPPNPPAPSSTTPFTLPSTIFPGQTVPFDTILYVDNDFSTVYVLYSTLVSPIGGTPAPYTFAWRVQGSRAVLVQFLPDWFENPPVLNLIFKTDVFQSDQLDEQRTSVNIPRNGNVPAEIQHAFDVVYKSEGFFRSTDLYNRLARNRARRYAIPFFGEPLIAAVDLAGQTQVTPTNVQLSSLIWIGDEIVRLKRGDPTFFETRKVTANDFGLNRITVDSPFTASLDPLLQELYYVRYVMLTGLRRTNDSDEHQTIAVGWESTD